MDFNVSSFIIAIISFAILYWLLNRYAFKPLFGMMEKRREMVVGQLADAQKEREAAGALLADQKQALQDARQEAHQVVEQARVTAARQAEEIVASAKAEATRLKDDAVRDIESEKNKAVAALRAEVSTISVAIASKIIERQVDKEAQQSIVDDYLKGAGGVQ